MPHIPEENDRAPILSRRDVLAAGTMLAGLATTSTHAANALSVARAPMRTSFTPGQIWLDTAGKPIQAHGGSIIQVGDIFYWYGENKEFTTGKTKVWTWGVRCYSSKDLYNWDDLGLIIPPDEEDITSPLHPTSLLDRPHILYNARTRKFICWVKIMGKTSQTRTVLEADRITGPYRIVRKDLRPLGMGAGDFDLVTSPADGKAYMYFERVHSEMICADLTDDYTDVTGYYSTHFPHPGGPPDVREGPAYFYRNNRHYLVTSGTTSYYPNPSEVAVADSFHGPFTTLGDLHPGDRTRTSFNCQISAIFRHPGKKDLYIALADQWWGPQSGSDFESGARSELIRNAMRKVTAHPPQPRTPEESASMRYLSTAIDTSKSRYAWLPIQFRDDRPIIEWRPEWRLDEYA